MQPERDDRHDETHGLPPWLVGEDDEADLGGDGGAGQRRRAWLAAVALAPWAVILVVLLRPGAAASAPPPTETGAALQASPGAVEPTAPPATTPVAETTPAATAPETAFVASGGRVAVTAADAAAVAVVVARGWLTGGGPEVRGLVGAAADPWYAEHLVAEAVDHPAPGHAVVSLLAVLLPIDGDEYGAPVVRRVAVPLAVDGDGARPAGTPWWLPSPDLGLDAVTAGDPVDDPDLLLEAAEAVDAAGYADVSVVEVRRTASWPLLALVRAVAPGEQAPDEYRIWLRRHLDGLVVAGARPAPRGESRP